MCLGVPGQIVSVEGEDILRRGVVDFSGATREVSLAYVPEAAIGDWVVVHVGVALSVIDETQARETLALLDEVAAASGLEAPE